jgi:hypothetical protein
MHVKPDCGQGAADENLLSCPLCPCAVSKLVTEAAANANVHLN